MDNDGEAGTPSTHQFVTVPRTSTDGRSHRCQWATCRCACRRDLLSRSVMFAAAMGELFASQQSQSPPVTADLGPFNPLVSRNLPPEQLVIIAIYPLVMVAAFAVALMVAALMSPARGARSPVPIGARRHVGRRCGLHHDSRPRTQRGSSATRHLGAPKQQTVTLIGDSRRRQLH